MADTFDELRDQAETLLATTDQALASYGDLLPRDTWAAATSAAAALRMCLSVSVGEASLRRAYERLDAAAFRVAAGLYGGDHG